MLFVEGTSVSYKDIIGVVSFCSKGYVSILIKKGNHPSQDVNIVVYQSDFKHIRHVKEK
jgi:hypothetical protein